ncbi:hypothetical protein G6F68_017582 [Rhizopus microsporus]|nr:hypothetical protein G6F68_017582 [Rhizopus microsporus]
MVFRPAVRITPCSHSPAISAPPLEVRSTTSRIGRPSACALASNAGNDTTSARREGADADQPGQGQAQLRMLHTFSLHPQHAGKGSNVRAARTPPADPLRNDECIHNENGVPHTLPHPVIVA